MIPKEETDVEEERTILREKGEYSGKIESYVRRWYVMSIISGRYAGSPESTFDADIRRIDEMGFLKYLEKC